MSIRKFLSGLFGSKAGQSVTAFAVSEAQHAVAALKTTAIGAAVAADIDALASTRLSGAQKFEQVVVNTLPLVAGFVTAPGSAAVAVADVTSITRELVQSVFNDTKSSTAGGIARLILGLIGLK